MPHDFRKFPCLFLAACLTAGMAGRVEAGSVQFSTYYPAPFGVYDRLRLPPRPALAEPCDAGTFYYETNAGLRFCDETTLTWGGLGGGVWTQSGNNIYPADTASNPNLMVGIGTTTPSAKLTIQSVDPIVGTLGFGDSWGNIWSDGGIDSFFTIANNGAAAGRTSFVYGPGNELLTIQNNGNVGIGTTTPSAKLAVVGGITLLTADSGSNNGFRIYDLSGAWYGMLGYGGTKLILQANDPNDVAILNAAGEGITVKDASGNVGIGTTAPNNSIQVKDLINFDNARGGTALGYQAGQIDAGSQNAFLGFQAGQANTTGSANTASGFRALQSNTIGIDNTAIGYQALRANTTGNANTASGLGALFSNTTGGSNTASGYGALQANTTGNSNTASGLNALFSNTTGNSNTASGTYALVANTTGWSNVANGGSALAANTTGVENVANGYRSLYSNTIGNDNTANGNYSLYNNTTGGANVANGANALFKNTTGNTNTANGTNSLYSNTTGSGNVANGYESLSVNTTGNYNTAIGYQAGFAPITGNSNVFIGYQAGYLETGSNKLYIANSSVNPPLIYGDFSTGNVGIGTTAPAYQLQLGTDSAAKPSTNTWTIASDERIKTGIDDFTDGLSTVLKLRPRTYKYNGSGGPGYDDADTHIGFVAQEAEPVAPYLVQTGAGVIGGAEVSDFKYYQGHALPFIIVNAIKEQQKQIEELKAENSALKNRIEILENK